MSHLRGMFAFALWDARTQTLFAARDHLGVKPFHYAWDGDDARVRQRAEGGARASRGASRDRPGGAAPLSRVPVHSGAAFACSATCASCCPAMRSRCAAGALDVRAYWRPDYASKLALSEAEAVDALDRELRASVEGMLVADVPLGAFVSGGVDSGLVAAMMTDLTRAPIDTFNIGFEGGVAVSEHREAARVAAAPGQPPSRADAVARSRARRVRPLDRRVRRAVRRPGGAADDAARGLRASRRHGRADGRGRRRGVRRLLELSQARARGAADALARAFGVAAAGDRERTARRRGARTACCAR